MDPVEEQVITVAQEASQMLEQAVEVLVTVIQPLPLSVR